MFEELNERRKAVERNIAKGFGMDDADLDFEKALEDELEKGRAKKQFNIGDTFTRHGITYKCTGISANTGRPTWSKVKDGGGKQEHSIKDVLSEIIHMDASDEADSTYQSDIVKRLQNHINKENISKEKFQNYLNAAGVNAEWCGYLKSVLNFKKEEQQPEKKEKREEDNQEDEDEIPFDVDLEVADEMWTGKESKAYDKVLESGDEKEQKRLLKIAIDRAKEKGVDIARKKDSDSMKGVTRHMSQGQEEEAVKQAMQSKKPTKEEKQKSKKLSELKRGDTVALIMERYNPQLGNYVTIKKVQIEGTTSKSFKIDYMKFDKETGERSDKSSSVYGSSTHYILLPEEVNSHIKDGKWKGDRISGGNPFEDE